MTQDGLLVHSGCVVTPSGVLEDGWVLAEHGLIVALGQGPVRPDAAITVDATGQHIAPGLIDLHTHGGDGADYTDGTLEAFERATRFAARHGVTALQATTTSMPLADIRRTLDTAREWLSRPRPGGATVLGIHLEGPHLAESMRGCHPARNLRTPSPEDTDLILSYRDVVTEVTLAPELPGGLEMTRRLADAGILVAAGHTAIYDDDIVLAIEAGVRHVTHLYACTSSLKREGGRRMIGLVEMALTRPELSVEIIGDGKHLLPVMIQLVAKCKGDGQLCVISDSMAGTGLPDGSPTSICGVPAIVRDGVAILADMSAWAGSATPLDQDLRNVVNLAGLPLAKALEFVTSTPAKVLGIAERKGSIALGMDADLVLLDRGLNVRRTVVAGETVFES